MFAVAASWVPPEVVAHARFRLAAQVHCAVRVDGANDLHGVVAYRAETDVYELTPVQRAAVSHPPVEYL